MVCVTNEDRVSYTTGIELLSPLQFVVVLGLLGVRRRGGSVPDGGGRGSDVWVGLPRWEGPQYRRGRFQWSMEG